MAEQDQKSSLTINDILDQLTKPSVLKAPEAPISRPNPPASPQSTSPAAPPPQTSASTGADFKLPQLGGTKKTEEQGSGGPQASTPEELKLAIRTMAADVQKLKEGQKPSGLEFQKSIGKKEEVPRPKPAAPPPPPPVRTEALPQQPLTAPQLFPRSSGIPTPKMQVPLPPPLPKRPVTPPPTQPSDHFHPEKIISGGSSHAGLPDFLGAPIPKRAGPKTPEEKLEYGLLARVIGSGMTTGIIGTIVIAIAAYFLVSFFLSGGIDQLMPSPTPSSVATVSVTPTPTDSELESIFKNISAIDFQLPEDKQTEPSSLRTFINSQTMSEREFKRLKLTVHSEVAPTFTGILTNLGVNFPSELINYLENNNMVFIYGQESPDPQDSENQQKRLVFVVEINDFAKVSEAMKKWESTITNDLKQLFEIDPSKQSTPNFVENNRDNVKIKYKNFPLPNKSIDYAIASSLSGKNYLIITNSRESMFSPLDKIRGR
jgi:hypothetical protein